MAPERELDGCCYVRLGPRGQHWEIPLLVLKRARQLHGRTQPKICSHPSVVQRSTLWKILPGYLLMSVVKLNLVARGDPVRAPSLLALSSTPQPAAQEVAE